MEAPRKDSYSRKTLFRFKRAKVNDKLQQLQEHLNKAVAKLDPTSRRSFSNSLKQLEKINRSVDVSTRPRVVSDTKITGFKIQYPIQQFVKEIVGNESETMCWTDLTRFANNYIKEHSLQDQSNRRHIIPDEILKRLLNYEAERDGPLSYQRMQQLLKGCFLPRPSKTTPKEQDSH